MSDSINSVNVLSVDEERRKFRVILGFTGAGAGGNPARTKTEGQFTVNLPPPIAIANSDQFDNCVIKVDSFTAVADAAIVAPTWRYSGGILKVPAIEILGNLPSSNVLSIDQDAAGDIGIGTIVNQGFAQLLPLQIVNVGDTASFTPAPGGFAATAIGSGVAASDAVLCGNPFGKDLTIRFTTPVIERGSNVWISQVGAAQDVGYYALQLSIELIPNK